MRRRLLILFVVLSLPALAAGGWFLYRILSAPAAPTASAALARVEEVQVQTINGETVVTVPVDMQRASGIVVTSLAATSMQPERVAYATAIDLQPLFDLGNRLVAAHADRNVARAQTDASQAQVARMQVLYQDDRNISQKNLQDARAAALSDQAKLVAAEAASTGIEAAIRQQFGEALARAAATPASGLWRQLASGQASIVRITFAASEAAPERVTIESTDGHPRNARKLSAAVQVDPMLQGSAYFYLIAPPLPAGTRTLAHAALGKPSVPAILIPDSAIVWYGDARWAYVKTANDRFTRRLVPAAIPASGGMLTTSGWRAGDDIVTRGAALLLSEEQRPRGVATQCKDPPECDD